MYDVWPSPFQPSSTPAARSPASARAHGYGVAGSCRSPTTRIGRSPEVLPAGVLLGWNGEGHTSYMQGSSCVDGYVDAYLINLKVPASGTVCA